MLLHGAAATEIPVDVFTDDEGAGRVEVRRRPIGVVAAIVPWNFPLALAAWKLAPALVTGNTVVLKPSPFAPVATLRLGEILGAIVPPGVLNVVSGGAAVGERLVTREAVRRVAFTGSQSTGKRVAQLVAGDLKRVSLELGGNDAAIVLADAEPSEIARRIFWGAFANSGQICTAIKRLFVAEEILEPLVAELVALARQTRVGDPFDPATELGPLGNAIQLERVIDIVADARRAGARVRIGGDRIAGPGFFYPPTIVTDIAEGTRLVDDEQFGPVLPVLSFRSPEEAIARANATRFGLSGSIWTGDPARGAALAAQLECGTGWVNQHMVISPHAPFGGWKWSGLGRENGLWGLESFTELQVLHARAESGGERRPT
jgi:acyl-CoA reductase-like NAD-dependent aldehyde dehydrogenase